MTRDMGYHTRRRAERVQDPVFRQEYEAARQQIDQADRVVRALDALRIDAGLPKAELARRIGKHPAAIRRLFSADGNPELGTIVAIAGALQADMTVVPRTPDLTSSSDTAGAACATVGWDL